MNQIIFRALIPIFRFEFQENDDVFEHHGEYKEATYQISLKQYEQGEISFNELMKYANHKARKSLESIHIQDGHPTKYFLIVDVTQSNNEELKVASNSVESVIIEKAITCSLRLSSTRGFRIHNSYSFRWPEAQYFNYSRGTPLISEYRFSHLGQGNSVLSADSFGDVISLFEKILDRETEESSTLSKVIDLAIDYHLTAFKIQKVEHAFLVLMVAFEALFKKDENENINQASDRVAKLLCSDRESKKEISKTFSGANDESLSSIRNKIAHGDPRLNLELVRAKYPLLYEYVRSAIVNLINLPNNTIGSSYYDDLTVYVNKRYENLF